MLDSGVFHTLYRTEALDMKHHFPKRLPRAYPPGESLYKQPVTPTLTHDAPGIQDEPPPFFLTFLRFEVVSL